MSTLGIVLGWLASILVVTLIGVWIDYQASKRYRGITDFDFGDIEDI